MTEYKEEPSLLEVREWKRKCQEKYKHLSDEEFLEQLERSSKEIKQKYNINLERIDSEKTNK